MLIGLTYWILKRTVLLYHKLKGIGVNEELQKIYDQLDSAQQLLQKAKGIIHRLNPPTVTESDREIFREIRRRRDAED